MLQPEQFNVPAHELLSDYAMWPGDRRGEPEHEAWLKKQQRSLDSGLVESIMTHGVINPILVSHVPYYNPGRPGHGELVILQGHHRAIAAATVDPDMQVPIAPVEHTSAWGPHGDLPEYKPVPEHPPVKRKGNPFGELLTEDES